jgi:predicted RNase H-like HicB family nuclease
MTTSVSTPQAVQKFHPCENATHQNRKRGLRNGILGDHSRESPHKSRLLDENTRARKVSPSKLNLMHMARKASVVIEKDDNGFYAWCPELKGCQSQGASLEEAISNIKEAIELYLETLPVEERDFLLSREILTTSVEVNA